MDSKGKGRGVQMLISMKWEHVLFAHWKVEKDIVQESLPEGMKVDTYDELFQLANLPVPKGEPHLMYGQEMVVTAKRIKKVT